MAENPTIVSLQNATKEAAEALVRDKEAAAAKKPPQQKPNSEEKPQTLPKDPPAGDKPPADPPSFDLKAHIKEKYGIELSDDELASRIKGGNGNNGQEKPKSRDKKEPPKLDDITDDQVSKFFEHQKKPDLTKTYADVKQKEDFALVKEHQRDLIKKQFPQFDEDEIEGLVKEHYYIADKDDDDPYTPDEKKLGEFLLKQDADRLRNSVGYQVDGVRNILLNQAMDEYNTYLYEDTVNSFLSTAPKELRLQFGKSGSIELGDYPVSLEDDTLRQVAEIMRSPMNLLNEFKQKKEDESLDLQKMFDFIIKAKLFDHVTKSAAVDYYSKGVDSVKNTLNNDPDLSKIRPAGGEKKNTKKEERDQAIDYNKKQVEENMGRGRK